MKLLLLVSMLSLSLSSMASRSYKAVNLEELPTCSAGVFGTQEAYTLELQRDEVAQAIILLAGTKGGGNYRGNSFTGCAENSEMSAEFFIEQLDVKRKFKKIARKIQRIFPSIDLRDNLDQTIVCQTEARLEKILGGQYDKDRSMVWMPKYKNSSDYIMYNTQPANNNKQERDEITWALVKELLHNHIQGGDYHVRDVQLQLIIRSLQAHIESKAIDEDELKNITDAFSFPTK